MAHAVKTILAFLVTGTLCVSLPLVAAEAADTTKPLDPQSPEAIQKIADELEADRKAREAGAKAKQETTGRQVVQPVTGKADQVTASDVARLKQQCDEAREEQIAPLRKAAIEECIAKKVKSASECENFYKDYGEAGVTQGGGFRQRMFHNIPECQPYYDAEKKLKK